MEHHIEIVSVKGGRFHRLANPVVSSDSKPWEPRRMSCGITLEPHNFFETAAAANKYTGGRLAKYICKHCQQVSA